jgi:hypothetical protein
MLNEAGLSDNFWREAVYIVVYILNRGKIRVNSEKTPYELWKGHQHLSNTLEYLEASVTLNEMMRI